MDFVQVVTSIKDYLTGLSASLLLPIFITILGLVFGQKLRTALRAGLTLGAGFIALNLVISLIVGEMVPVVNVMVENTGSNLDLFDVGWGVAGAIAWGTKAGSLVILVCLGVNIIMLALKLTKTLNVDIWNFWHEAFTASVCYIASGSLAWGLIAAAIHTVFSLVIADLTAKDVQEFYNLPGISIPQGGAVASVPFNAAINWVLDRIPGVKDIHWDESNIREKWGILGEPLFQGVVLGIVIGLFGGMWNDIPGLLTLGITIGTAMILIPKIIGFFMEALTPIAESARTFMQKKFGGREFYIGLDSAVLIGHPITVAAGIILIPIVLGLSLILPGNRVLPFSDLSSTFYFVAMAPFMTKGNLFRTVVCGTVYFAVVLYACTSFGSALTEMATSIGYAIPEGAVEITGLSAGNWLVVLLFQIGKLFGG